MIVESKTIKIDSMNINEIISDTPYYFCTYDDELNVEVISGHKVSGVLQTLSNVFGATTKVDLDKEVLRLKLKK